MSAEVGGQAVWGGIEFDGDRVRGHKCNAPPLLMQIPTMVSKMCVLLVVNSGEVWGQ